MASKWQWTPEALRLVSLGLLDAKQPTLKKLQNAREAFKKLNRVPSFRERVAALDAGTTEFVPENITQKIIDPAEFQRQGKVMTGLMSDPSDIGTLKTYQGVPVNEPVQGGTKHTAKYGGENIAWRSMGSFEPGKMGTAEKAQNRLISLGNLLEMDPVAGSYIMKSTGTNFSTPPAAIIKKQLDAFPPSAKARKAFDDAMRKQDKSWVGLDSDNAMDQLMGTNGFPMEGAGSLRKKFLAVTNSPEMRDMGFPQSAPILDVINNPEFKDMPFGAMGANFWYPDVTQGAYLDLGDHLSYSHVIPGTEAGRYEVPVSWQAQNPDAYDILSKEMTKPKEGSKSKPRPYTVSEMANAQATRTMGDPGTYQKANQRFVDSVSAAIEHNKKLIEKYGTMAAALAAGEVMADEGNVNELAYQSYMDRPFSGLDSQNLQERSYSVMDKPYTSFDEFGDKTYVPDPQPQQTEDTGYTPAFANLVRKYGFAEAQKKIKEIEDQIKRRDQIRADAAKMASWERESHRGPRSDTLIDIGNFIKADEGNIGLLDAMGTTLEKIGQGMELSTGDYIFPALEVAALPAMKPSISSLRSVATKGQPFRHYVDDAVYYDRYGKRMGGKGVSGAELLGSAADYGLNTAFSAATLEEILRKMSEQ